MYGPCLYKNGKRLNSVVVEETETFTCKRIKSMGNTCSSSVPQDRIRSKHHHQKPTKGLYRRGSLAGLLRKIGPFLPAFCRFTIIIRMSPKRHASIGGERRRRRASPQQDICLSGHASGGKKEGSYAIRFHQTGCRNRCIRGLQPDGRLWTGRPAILPHKGGHHVQAIGIITG